MDREEKRNSVFNALLKELGSEKVFRAKDILEKYSTDETSNLTFSPDMIVKAITVSDVSTTMIICNNHRFPVTPRGAGTGVTGGALPVNGGVVLSLENMNRILEIDTENMIAVVEPGVITGDLQKAALKEGLMYPPDPASLETCSIGGNVAEGAGGPKAVKYGTTKDYVLGLEYVLPDGSVMTTGGKYVKNATGYNLTGTLIGSEGTLAVITKIYLKLIPAPDCIVDLLIPFDSVNHAIDTVITIIKNRVIPSTIELMEENAITIVSRYLGEEMLFPEASAHLLIQIDGYSENEVKTVLEKLIEVIDIPRKRIVIAEDDKQRERIWKARRSIRDSIQDLNPVFLAEDSVVPRSEISSFLIELKEKLGALNITSLMFGHAGDGNIHINILKGTMDTEQWNRLVPQIKEIVYRTAIAHNGTITGEHGIGYIRRAYVSMALSHEEIELLKRIKNAFDPNGILNPNKVF